MLKVYTKPTAYFASTQYKKRKYGSIPYLNNEAYGLEKKSVHIEAESQLTV